jgi:hypothetical protein
MPSSGPISPKPVSLSVKRERKGNATRPFRKGEAKKNFPNGQNPMTVKWLGMKKKTIV